VSFFRRKRIVRIERLEIIVESNDVTRLEVFCISLSLRNKFWIRVQRFLSGNVRFGRTYAIASNIVVSDRIMDFLLASPADDSARITKAIVDYANVTPRTADFLYPDYFRDIICDILLDNLWRRPRRNDLHQSSKKYDRSERI
jgi:hypothetical protein